MALLAAVVAGGAVAAVGASASAVSLSGVTAANPKVTGVWSANRLSPQITEHTVAEGAMPLENPTSEIGYYGYLNDGPLLPAPGDVQAPGHDVEASKTEPDKNTYLVVSGQHGADAAYDYGTHFLYQGHETDTGYVTRVNLDADAAHRVTLLASQEADGSPLPLIDGSTWDPFTRRLLFTVEGGAQGGALEGTLDFPSTVRPTYGILGQGGFEGIQVDSTGKIYIVEDSGGPSGAVNTHAKQPNSFIFRFEPTDPANLWAGGVLQALQVISKRSGQPIVFHPGQADADILSDDVKDLHTYGLRFRTHWVTVHDTATDGTAAFDANAAAKSAGATPFKRPENGVFRPSTGFAQLFFSETGDTNALTEAGTQYGGFGGDLRADAEPGLERRQPAPAVRRRHRPQQLRQHLVLRPQQAVRGRGSRRPAARPGERARLRLAARRARDRSADPGALAGRRP